MEPQCACSGGYTDPRCLTPPDKCEDNDCAQGSTCLAGTGEGAEYTCACPPGFTGKLCEDEQRKIPQLFFFKKNHHLQDLNCGIFTDISIKIKN